jgi:hypothetical protein
LSSLEPGETEEEMAEVIQALIELLSESIIEKDLSDITGKDIVDGDYTQVATLLQIIYEISELIKDQ